MSEIYKLICKGVVPLFLLLSMTLASYDAHAQVEALATCDDVTTDNTYNVKITGLNDVGVYTFIVGDTTITTVSLALLPIPITIASSTIVLPVEEAYINGLDTILVRVIDNTNPIAPDTTDIIVHEALCVDADNDGDFDFNEASCDYTSSLPDIGTIVSTVAPYNGTNVYLYMLTDSAGVVPSSLVTSNTGHFTGLANGTYKVYAYNFLNTTDEAAFLATITAGTSDLDDFGASSDPICYNFCGATDVYTIDCVCPIVIDADPEPLALCEDGDGDMFVSVSTTVESPVAELSTPNQFNYQWQEDAGTGFVDYADTDSILNLTGVTASMDGYEYRVIVTLQVDGTAICSDTSAAAALSIFPEPAMATDLDAVACSDESSGIILRLDGANAAVADSFDLVAIDSNGLDPSGAIASLGWGDSLMISSDAWTNTSSGPVVITYSVAPISGDCIGDTIDIELTVNPKPLFSGDLDDEVCSDDIVGVTLPTSANVTIDSFEVTASVGTGLLGTATTGSTISASYLSNDVFTNLSGETDTVTYTVVPFADGCEGSSFDIKVAIKPEPRVVVDLSTTVCSDTEINVTLPSADSSGLLAIDSFYVSAGTTGLVAVAQTTDTMVTTTDAILADTYTNSGTTTDSVTYTLTPYSAGCIGDDFTITVRVTTEPIGIDSTLFACSDETLSIDLQSLISNGMTGVEFEWFAIANDSITGETTSASSASSITDILTNTTASNEDVVYKVIPTASAADGSCLGDTITVTVTVYPEPVYEDEYLTVCSGESLDIDLTDNAGANSSTAAGFTYTVTSSDDTNVPAGTARTDTTDTNITDTYVNTTADTVTITYTVTPISTNDCAGDDFTVTVRVDPEPVLADNLSATVCSDSPIGVTLAVAETSVAADSFIIVSITAGDSLTEIAAITADTTVGSASAIANDVWENTSSVTDSVIYQVAPMSASGCIGDTVSIVITVDPEVTVEAGVATTLCSTAEVILADLNPSISGGSTTGTWSSSGTGTFVDGTDSSDTSFAGAVSYKPSAADKANGGVTLTLTSGDPEGECTGDSDSVEIIINSVECSTFPWTGGE